MPFRSVKSWSATTASKSLSVLADLAPFLGLSLLAVPKLLFATGSMPVTPQLPGNVNAANGITGGSTGPTGAPPVGGQFWVAAKNAAVTPIMGNVFLDAAAGFISANGKANPGVPIDVTATQATDPSGANAIYFDVWSPKGTFTLPTTPPNSFAVLVVSVIGVNGTNRPVVPIAWRNGQSCTGNANCYRTDEVLLNGSHFYAVTFDPTNEAHIQVGIYPADLCADENILNPSVPLPGCTAGAVTMSATAAPQAIPLSFDVFTMSTTAPAAAAPIGTVTYTALDNGTLSMSLQGISTSVTTCTPNGTDGNLPADFYRPGDTQIFVNTGEVLFNSIPGNAPPTSVLVVGKKSGPPVIDSTYSAPSVNDVALPTPGFGGYQTATGFTNSTTGSVPGGDNQYNVQFMVRDWAGLVAPPTAFSPGPGGGAASCSIAGLQTAAIQGFLSKSNCFIATAAFRSIEALPVAMLRQFRDEVLLPTLPGRAFVRWYYSWSPDAAEWLMENAAFRFPILVLLMPLEALAWLTLHPFLFWGLFAASLGVLTILPRLPKEETP
ncbi:MAG: CFI-box-CTERM domain-containing protein [Bdellovibrionota bacterium]